MKNIISFLLVIAILITSVSMLSVFAVDEGEYMQDSITVDRMGTYLFVTVFTNEKGKILIPVDILSFCGGLYEASDDTNYIYYDGVQSVGYEKEIQIRKDGSSAKSVVYITPYNFVTLASIDFSDSYEYDDQLFLPLTELLPFLDADVEITDDGILHIYPNPVSIFNAIAYDTLEDDTFSSDNVVGGKFIGVAGRLIDSIINLRFDRLDIVMHSGKIKDYNEIYKTLLTDNEIYLAAFDKEVTPFENALDVFNDAFDTNNDFVDFVDDLVDTVWIKQAKYILQAKGFKNYKEFSKELKEMKEWSGLEYSADIAEGIFRILDYSNAYVQQVEDHRDMLYAVYNSNFDFDHSRTQAANETALLYSEEFVEQLLSMSTVALRDYIVEVGTKEIEKELVAPFKVAFELLKFFKPKTEETLKNSSNMFYLDGIISDSTEAVEYYLSKTTFDKNTLENLRLSMIMALIASKYAYEIYYDGGLDYKENGGDKAWKYYKINEWLTQLYLAADSVECNTPEYFDEKKEELTNSIKYLQLSGDSNPDNSEGLEFTLNDDGVSYSVTGTGTCTDTDIVIPSTYNGKPVTSIGYEAFANFSLLKSIQIPNTVISIGAFAFTSCHSLTSIEIPDSVTRIDYYAFEDCTSLTSIVIPDSVTSIGYSAFRNCTSLTSVTIGDYVTEIDRYAFYNCTSLTSINIPNSVTRIGEYSFYGCTSLTSIVIPNSVTSIGGSAFRGCDSLTSIVIPYSVTSIGDYAFEWCQSLTSIEIPDSVMSIGDYVFSYCTSLTSLVISDSVTNIGDGAFWGCHSLISIEIPDSVMSIGDNAFYWCTSLTSIEIPDSVTSIGDWAFGECKSLASVEIGNSVTSIGDYAFYWCSSLTSVVIPNAVTSIGNKAFADCTLLTSIVIPDSVTSIGSWAFAYCYKLTIYCEAESQPEGWDMDWNYSYRPVVWGYDGE